MLVVPQYTASLETEYKLACVIFDTSGLGIGYINNFHVILDNLANFCLSERLLNYHVRVNSYENAGKKKTPRVLLIAQTLGILIAGFQALESFPWKVSHAPPAFAI